MIQFLAPLLGIADRVLDRVLPDTAERDKVKAELQKELLNNAGELEKAAAGIVLAEAQGASWLQRNWRPLLMLVIIAIIANNYLIVPWLSLFTEKVAVLVLPGELYTLMTVGVGGYVGGRTVEKGLKVWKDK